MSAFACEEPEVFSRGLCQGETVIAVSIVSHAHGVMVERLVNFLLAWCPEVSEVIVTRNVSEAHPAVTSEKVRYLLNASPSGFGANHNAAFAVSRARYFCVMNPDVSLTTNPFPALLGSIVRTASVLVAPVVRSPDGGLEDSARHFPTVFSLCRKAVLGQGAEYSFALPSREFYPEWVAGMFMLFRRDGYECLGGFDERFFLYYEDVDLCARAWARGMKIVVSRDAVVIHDARRASHRNLRHFFWHASSAVRYLMRYRNCLRSIKKMVSDASV